MPPRESDAAAETAGALGGQKCSVIKQSPFSDPLPGLTETGQTPTTHPAILPAPRAPPDSSGIQDSDPTRSTAGRRNSTFFALLLSGTGIPVFPVWLCRPPGSGF